MRKINLYDYPIDDMYLEIRGYRIKPKYIEKSSASLSSHVDVSTSIKIEHDLFLPDTTEIIYFGIRDVLYPLQLDEVIETSTSKTVICKVIQNSTAGEYYHYDDVQITLNFKVKPSEKGISTTKNKIMEKPRISLIKGESTPSVPQEQLKALIDSVNALIEEVQEIKKDLKQK